MSAPDSAPVLDRGQPPRPGPVRAFDFPTVHRYRIDGAESVEVLTARHGDLPLVTAEVVLDAGAAHEPQGQGGIARLTAQALEGGTEAYDVEELAWELESLGVELSAGSSWDAASIGVTVHRDRLDPAMELLAEIVRRPVFPEDQVERIRDQQLATILQRRKEPRGLASDAAARFIFDAGIPYSRPLSGREASVRELGPDALRAFHEARYRAGSAALVLTGAVDAEAACDAARRHFGDWSGAPAPSSDFEVRPYAEGTRVFIVDRPGAVQSEIRMGHVGVRRHHADYFPLLVMNTILGGAFTSRLNMNLRERHGFTYGARSGFDFRRQPGPFVIQAAVASDVTARAIQEAWKEVHLLRDEGPAAHELESARDYLRGVLPLRLQTTEELASRLASLAIFDLPDDYFQHYRQEIADVSADDVLRVAREAVRPEDMAIVVVGDADQIEEPLRELGIGDVEVHREVP